MTAQPSGLQSAVADALRDFRSLAIALDGLDSQLRPGFRSTLGRQIAGLQVLHDECVAGELSRRTWSIGQAAMPVLSSLLNAARKPKVGVDRDIARRCRTSLNTLGGALMDHAEGRS